MGEVVDIEALLRSALLPVEPSEGMSDRLERGLSEITDLAAEELADWELSTMRDPRNWGRPVAAVVVGGAAAGALVVVRARQQQKKKGGGLRGLRGIEKGMRDMAGDLQKRLGR